MPDSLPEQAAERAEAEAGARRVAPARGGCWQVGGITCGVLFCMFGVLSLLFFILARPYVGRYITEGGLLTACEARLEGDYGLQGALQRYVSQKREYPARLGDLNPSFLTKKSSFHCPADPSPPDTVSYIYRRPAPDAPKDTIVLICDHHTLVGTPLRLKVPIEGAVRVESQFVGGR